MVTGMITKYAPKPEVHVQVQLRCVERDEFQKKKAIIKALEDIEDEKKSWLGDCYNIVRTYILQRKGIII